MNGFDFAGFTWAGPSQVSIFLVPVCMALGGYSYIVVIAVKRHASSCRRNEMLLTQEYQKGS